MTAENFCYWLKGFVELTLADARQEDENALRLTPAQTDMVRRHLDLVFNKVTASQPLQLIGGITTGVLPGKLASNFPCPVGT